MRDPRISSTPKPPYLRKPVGGLAAAIRGRDLHIRRSSPWWLLPLILSALIVALTGSLFLFAPNEAPRIDYRARELKQAREETATWKERAQAAENVVRYQGDDMKRLTDRYRMTVFPTADQAFLVDLQAKRIAELERELAAEKELRLLVAKESAWIEKNAGELVIEPRQVDP